MSLVLWCPPASPPGASGRVCGAAYSLPTSVPAAPSAPRLPAGQDLSFPSQQREIWGARTHTPLHPTSSRLSFLIASLVYHLSAQTVSPSLSYPSSGGVPRASHCRCLATAPGPLLSCKASGARGGPERRGGQGHGHVSESTWAVVTLGKETLTSSQNWESPVHPAIPGARPPCPI